MSKPFRILSIDGGGIRGVIPGTILAHLEAYVQKKSNDPALRLADVFDMIAGTSTGGILTCIYLCPDPEKPKRPRFSARDAVGLYLNWGDDIFHVPLFRRVTSGFGVLDEKYPAKVIETALSKYFGDLKLSQLLKPCLVTAYDIAAREAVIFNSDDNRANTAPGKDYFLRDVARATSAAPTYFEPADILALNGDKRPLIDGGVFANNPALCAIAEFLASPAGQNKGIRDIALLSLGTGSNEKKYSFSEAKDWGAVGWIRPVIDITLSGVAETVCYQAKKLFDGSGVPAQHLRIDPIMTHAKPEMDNATLENMAALERDGDAAYQKFQKQLEDFADSQLLGT